MSSKKTCIQVPRKMFRLNSWIAQIICQWIPNVLRWTRGTDSCRCLTDRTCWRPRTSDTSTQ